ncbi:hypothetical protein HN031_07775 [Nocardioides sp. zg-1308]|uniref:hypothetical protein n=1 Tax=Nocardioides sp. zg-1308 TaxID=2736253 RepID=UPI001556B729|nr:hypothetical protein [Nocardioides sp. zg-1308]NPD04581.1 hypothetical protein [Nocardioides sp. zg-1308]
MTTSTAPAHGWVAHLRAGGTTPWLAWPGRADAAGPDRGGPEGARLPGAQQLELLRRVNLAVASGVPARRDDAFRARLADRVLTTTAAGRGKADLPLVGLPVSSFGPQPVDPAAVSAHELLRVASVLVADDLVALGPDPVRTRWARPWRRRFRLVGDPLVTTAAREHLVGRGRPEGGPRPFVVAVGAPLDVMLAHAWAQRCFEHGSRPWGDWLRYWRERDQLPPRVDLDDSVHRWGGRRPYVRVVTDLEQLPRQLGVRHLPQVRVPGAEQAELGRRVASVVGLRAPVAERPALMRTLQRRIPDSGAAPVGLPDRERAWVASSAARLTRRLTRAGYPVVGDLADLAPRAVPSVTASGVVDDDRVLDLAIRMVVDPTWRERAARQTASQAEGTAEGTAERQVER